MIENSNETNLRSVTTKVTVRDAHSVVKTYTERIQRYCVTQFPIKYSHIIGIPMFTIGRYTGADALLINKCSQMLLNSRRNPGNGKRC